MHNVLVYEIHNLLMLCTQLSASASWTDATIQDAYYCLATVLRISSANLYKITSHKVTDFMTINYNFLSLHICVQ